MKNSQPYFKNIANGEDLRAKIFLDDFDGSYIYR